MCMVTILLLVSSPLPSIPFAFDLYGISDIWCWIKDSLHSYRGNLTLRLRNTYVYACACVKVLLAVYQIYVVAEECPTSVGEFSFELIIRCLRRANLLIRSDAIEIIFLCRGCGGGGLSH